MGLPVRRFVVIEYDSSNDGVETRSYLLTEHAAKKRAQSLVNTNDDSDCTFHVAELQLTVEQESRPVVVNPFHLS